VPSWEVKRVQDFLRIVYNGLKILKYGLKKIYSVKLHEYKGIFVINSFKNLLTNRE